MLMMIFQVPFHKVEKLKGAICDMLASDRVPIRDIAKIEGYVVAMTIALGPITRLFTRQMYFVIMCRR